MMGMAGLAQRDVVALAQIASLNPPLFVATVKQLDSLDWATADPPPRLV